MSDFIWTALDQALYDEMKVREIERLDAILDGRPVLPWTDGLGDSELLG